MIKVVTLFFLLLFFSQAVSSATYERVEDTMNVSAEIVLPWMEVEIEQENLDFGKIVLGYADNTPKQFNVTNKGTMDVTIKPELEDPLHPLFSRLLVGTSKSSTAYKPIGNFTGSVAKASTLGEERTEDFWMKLNLSNFENNIEGQLEAKIIFWIMPA